MCYCCTLTSERGAGGDGGHPPPVSASGDTHLAVDMVTGLTEEVDGALLGEPPTRRRVTAEPPMLRHQRVGAVTEAACRQKHTL